MTLRYPEMPTQDERDALNSYFHLLSRLYPCGECAAEFQQLLKKYPPQVRSFPLAIHVSVNERICADLFTAIRRNLVSAFSNLSADKCLHNGGHFVLCRLCFVHNQVNARLGKPDFDCAHLDETYDCGCGDEPVFSSNAAAHVDSMDLEVDPSKDSITGVDMIKGGR